MYRFLRKWISLVLSLLLVFAFAAAGTAENNEVQDWISQAQEALGQEDYESSLRYFTLAADLGNADRQECLGYLYLEGLGVEQSREKAVELYKLAAEGGSEEAQQQLILLGE